MEFEAALTAYFALTSSERAFFVGVLLVKLIEQEGRGKEIEALLQRARASGGPLRTEEAWAMK